MPIQSDAKCCNMTLKPSLDWLNLDVYSIEGAL